MKGSRVIKMSELKHGKEYIVSGKYSHEDIIKYSERARHDFKKWLEEKKLFHDS